MLNRFDYKGMREILMRGYYELENNGTLSSDDVLKAIKKVSAIESIIIELWNEMCAGRINNPTNNMADTMSSEHT